jgi:hypothetical protein
VPRNCGIDKVGLHRTAVITLHFHKFHMFKKFVKVTFLKPVHTVIAHQNAAKMYKG